MTLWNQEVTAGSTPYGGISLTTGSGKSYAQLRVQNGTSSFDDNPECRLVANTFTPDTYSPLIRASMGFNMDLTEFPYELFTITSASVRVGMKSSTNGTLWTASKDEGAGLVLMDDSLKTVDTVEDSDFQAVYNGGFTEVSSRLGYSSWSNGATHEFVIDSTGIDYLNTIRSKASLTNDAFFGIVFGAEIDNVTPTWSSANTHRLIFDGNGDTYPAKLYLGFNSPIQIRIGTAWKQCFAARIRIGTAWKDITDLNLKVGTWKDYK